ncbi:serine/threonine-protein kinase pim-1-like [Stegastes partitus]|uniref:non-specific serine/threonine protein kinase n=1 Tax=Stegastes partitus TaxID=144197 RepID=A0A9Y4MTU4_9TELE|nr:PREDICTED: serine/threonine-protein kinase pim-1-like [Stegastes partitus]
MVELQTVPRSSVGASAPIELLDWFDLDQELILVLETPIPCKDLLGYVWDNGASLEEEEAKIILKQLQNSHVFHRDIKPENILLETGSDVPRLRLIDFVVSCVADDTSWFIIFIHPTGVLPSLQVQGWSYHGGAGAMAPPGI